jgi:PKD repeat protein
MKRFLLALTLLAASGCERPFFQLPIRDLNRPPSARIASPDSGTAGVPISFDATASFDPDRDDLVFAWNFGDSADGAGVVAEHTYLSEGIYEASLVVTDTHGAASTARHRVTIVSSQP